MSESTTPVTALELPGFDAPDVAQGPRRRVRARTWVTGAVLVVLVAGVATLGGLLIQTRGVLDWQKGEFAKSQSELAATVKDLDKTAADLTTANLAASKLQEQLTDAQNEASAAKTQAQDLRKVADDLDTCLGTVLNDGLGDTGLFGQCISAIQAHKTLVESGLAAA